MGKKQGDLDIPAGTVLAIPLGERRWALGQVISPGVHFYLGVVLKEFEEPIHAADIECHEFGLYSWTNDAEVYRGNWKNLGQYELQEHHRLPDYKVTINERLVVRSFLGDKIRDFRPDEDGKLQNRKIRSPLLVQDAVQAALGPGNWMPFYEAMKP